MKITVIYGTMRKEKSSTWQIAQQFIGRLSENDIVKEFYLPAAMPNFCRSCWQCFEDYTKCPDYSYLAPILDAILEAELLVFTSPVYVYHVTGQMKAFLDHFGYQWMVHQPRPELFCKQVLLISTAAGGGTKSTLRDLKDNMRFWGISHIYCFRQNVRAAEWSGVSSAVKEEIGKKVSSVSHRVRRGRKHLKPAIKTKAMFYAMRFLQKHIGLLPADVAYWEKMGWLSTGRPWKAAPKKSSTKQKNLHTVN